MSKDLFREATNECEEGGLRWYQANRRDNYMEWQSYAVYLRGLSRIAFAENSFCMANDLLMLAQVAHQRALDLQPKHDLEAA